MPTRHVRDENKMFGKISKESVFEDRFAAAITSNAKLDLLNKICKYVFDSEYGTEKFHNNPSSG